MQDFAEEFRQTAQARLGGRRSPGRYPDQLRDLALSHLSQVRKAGGKANQAARELGIDANTLRGWEKTSGNRDLGQAARGSLVPVVVTEPHDDPATRGSAYRIHGPFGLCIECWSASAVAALVRALA
jgi:hypothetical protein